MVNFKNSLVYLTVAVFAVLALLFLYASFYIWYQSQLNPNYEESHDYLNYIDNMNFFATLPAVLLVVLLVLCLERKSNFRSSLLIVISIIALSIFAFVIYGGKYSVGFATLSSTIYQFFLLVRLLSGSNVPSEKYLRVQKAGSLILHSGFSLLIFAWVPLNSSEYEIPVFWISVLLITTGCILSFFGAEMLKVYKKIFNL
ncbi:MAG: hypothetical protein N2440_00105 [Actinobacteria bacterium]|nr:hypothetical protein [Actinomycetota bacterium]